MTDEHSTIIDAVCAWWAALLAMPLENDKPRPDAETISRIIDALRPILASADQTQTLMLGVDYEPYGPLAEANKAAGSPDFAWPGKARMSIEWNLSLVKAKECRSCPWETVYLAPGVQIPHRRLIMEAFSVAMRDAESYDYGTRERALSQIASIVYALRDAVPEDWIDPFPDGWLRKSNPEQERTP